MDVISEVVKTRKVIMVGNSGVGKTSVMFTYVEGTFRNHFATIGAGQRSKLVDVEGVKVNLDIWDTAGQERYRSQLRMYMMNAAVAIVMFDVTDDSSFNEVRSWVQSVHDAVEPDTKIFLVGNKTDLEISPGSCTSKAEALAGELGLDGYFQTSAAKGDGIDTLFTTVAEAALQVPRNGDKGVDLKAKKLQNKCC